MRISSSSSFFVLGSMIVALAGCGSSSDDTTTTTDTGTPADTATGDTGTKPDTSTTDGGTDTATADTGKGDAGTAETSTETGTDAGADAADTAGMAKLTVNNYLSWCSVEINGAAGTTAAATTISVPIGTVVTLKGDAVSPFFWGYWTGTAGDTTAAHDTAKSTTVTVSADKTVLACCPTAAGGTCP